MKDNSERLFFEIYISSACLAVLFILFDHLKICFINFKIGISHLSKKLHWRLFQLQSYVPLVGELVWRNNQISYQNLHSLVRVLVQPKSENKVLIKIPICYSYSYIVEKTLVMKLKIAHR